VTDRLSIYIDPELHEELKTYCNYYGKRHGLKSQAVLQMVEGLLELFRQDRARTLKAIVEGKLSVIAWAEEDKTFNVR